MVRDSIIAPQTGNRMPLLGLGTWQLTHDTADAVAYALELDTSSDYGTQSGIGEDNKVNIGNGIVGYFFAPEQTSARDAVECPAVLFIPEWGSYQTKNIDLAKDLVALGYACLTIDLRGQGESEGDFETLSGADHLDDVKASYDFLSARDEVDSQQISVVGPSYGGFLATLLASEREVEHLVLRVPVSYKDDSSFEISTYEVRKGYNIQDYRRVMAPADSRLFRAASQFTGSVYIIESEKDEIIPHQTIENYKNAFTNVASLKYSLMHGARHILNSEEQSQYRTLLTAYFSVL